MGVDLTLVLDKYELSGPILAHDRLSLRGRHYDLWVRLDAAGTPVAEGIDWYGDEGIERRTENPYGDPIKAITAFQFIKAWDEFSKGSHWGDWDLAVAAFIRALPAATKIVLWFH
jgi:hypothetical protein